VTVGERTGEGSHFLIRDLISRFAKGFIVDSCRDVAITCHARGGKTVLHVGRLAPESFVAVDRGRIDQRDFIFRIPAR